MVWTVVLTFVFLECAFILGLFLPGDSLLFTAGVVLAQQDSDGHAWLLSLVAVGVAIVGNQLGYFIGRTAGYTLIARRDGRVLTLERLAKARDFLERRGFWAIVLARWIPWIRTLAPLVAGAAKMSPRRFLLATSIGAALWVPTLVLVGYYAAGILDVFPWLKPVAFWGCIGFFVLGTAYGIWRYRQEMRRPKEVVVARESF
ncbi:MAG: DedA family protein [Pseudonocardiaceae bacterium]|nr:DedA family protein [Pseudonocardiaceae bacterium]